MPATEVLLYQDEDGTVPVLEWLRELQRKKRKAFDKCLLRINDDQETE